MPGTLSWPLAPDAPVIGRQDVHIWRASLSLSPMRLHSLERMLAPDEQRKADRFHFREDRKHFIAARGLLRVILSRYTGVDPAQLRFCYSPYGKPALTPQSNRDLLQFNLSHSQGTALYAITHGRRIGIDLEQIRTDRANYQIASQFFAPGEVCRLRALPESALCESFFQCWTRKEAYIKARGEGLSLPLDKFEVSFGPEQPAVLLGAEGDPQEASRWSMKEVQASRGYAAAVVVEGHNWQPTCWQLREFSG